MMQALRARGVTSQVGRPSARTAGAAIGRDRYAGLKRRPGAAAEFAIVIWFRLELSQRIAPEHLVSRGPFGRMKFIGASLVSSAPHYDHMRYRRIQHRFV